MAKEKTKKISVGSRDDDSYQILLTNIKFDLETADRKRREYPETMSLDVPEGIMKNIGNEQKFKEDCESFAYNTLTRKFGAECCFCQIWLPMK